MATKNFAQIETSFILRNAKYNALTAYAKALYIGLWAYAVDQRRERLDFPKGTLSIRQAVAMDARSCRQAVAQLSDLGLIKWDGERFLTVCGVRKCHSKLTDWHEESAGESRVEKSREENIYTFPDQSQRKVRGEW